MLLPTSTVFESGPLDLERGGRLERLAVAYETWGRLDADGGNAILIAHGYTSNPHAAGPGGWWEPLIGPGRAIDTDRWFVVCSNMIGSAYGSSGPVRGQPFPDIETGDMVAAQHRLLEHLGVGQLAAVVGFSYGGHLTFEWGSRHPERMRALVPVATGIASRMGEERALALEARFAGLDDPTGELERLRFETLERYGDLDWFSDRLGSREAGRRKVEALARKWAREFTPESLIVLARAAARFDARPRADAIRAPLLYVLSRSDVLFTPALAEPTLALLGPSASYFEIDSPYGHRAPSHDWAKWATPLAEFLATHAG